MELEDHVRALLEQCSTLTLATFGPDGPWAADVFFAPDGPARLIFISNPASRHGRNLIATPATAATVHAETGHDWKAIRGLQISGEAGLVSPEQVATAQAAYFAKFPFAKELLKPDSAIAARTSRTRFYELRVRELYVTDNSLGFGNRRAVTLGA